MKKLLAVLLIMCAMLLSSCGKGNDQPSGDDSIHDTHAHSFEEWQTTYNPTCTTAGERSRYCACGEMQTERIPETGHNPSEAVVENLVNATCTIDGSYDEVVYCSIENCMAELSRTTIVVSATGHSFDQWEIVKEATSTEEGLMERSCGCGALRSQCLYRSYRLWLSSALRLRVLSQR